MYLVIIKLFSLFALQVAAPVVQARYCEKKNAERFSQISRKTQQKAWGSGGVSFLFIYI